MNNITLSEVIRRPILTEKSTRIADKNRQITFEVLKAASKKNVKNAVEQFFKVEVEAVQLLNVKPKSKMFRQRKGVRKAIKKAYVTLKKGHDISFNS